MSIINDVRRTYASHQPDGCWVRLDSFRGAEHYGMPRAEFLRLLLDSFEYRIAPGGHEVVFIDQPA